MKVFYEQTPYWPLHIELSLRLADASGATILAQLKDEVLTVPFQATQGEGLDLTIAQRILERD